MWLFIPIFTGIVVIPATFSFITHGHIVVTLWTWHGHAVGLTEQGLTAAGLIVMRVARSISLVVLLTLTTPWAKLAGRGCGPCSCRASSSSSSGWPTGTSSSCSDSVTDMYTARKAAHGRHRATT